MTNSADAASAENNVPLRSVHTNSFVTILKKFQISLLVSTYQAGKLIVVRADGENLNTHFRVFPKPMGIALDSNRLALGTSFAIWELHNNPSLAQKIEPQGKHDACFLPRSIHITGNIDIHEMAWSRQELWFINTKFSCLCTLDKNHSFLPRWQPSFITAYDLRDRCHLNGLAMKDNQPRYVTALGETDTPGGWRSNKASGGILIDIHGNKILRRGLSMPHSPRWYNDRLWVLESGRGSLAYLDPDTQEIVTVAEVPGFTRGLDFYGNLAFIGLSQIRESAVFSGLPLTQRLEERISGVWVVDIRDGRILAFLKFEEAVQEIFAVSVLVNTRFPEVVDWDQELMSSNYVLPDAALAKVVQPSQEWEFAEKYFVQGNKLYGRSQLTEAIAAYRKCLELDPSYLPARFNLGVTLGDLGEYPEAIEQLERVIKDEARHAEAYNSLGFIYSQQRQLQLAASYYEKAIEINPKFAKAHHNLGMTLLQLGIWQRGWVECEWRWKTEQMTPLQVPHPLWEGQPIPDKTLLVHTEQGNGDAIQFIRYLPLIAPRCGKIILVCSPSLIPLFQQLDCIDEIRTAGEISAQAFDTYIPLMSLPHILQTTLETIPAEIPYLQAVKPGTEALVSWLQRQKRPNCQQVGIVWSGSLTNGNHDKHHCPISYFVPLLRLPQVIGYSLQVGEKAGEITQIPKRTKIVDLSDRLQDYGDTAAAIAQLDLVITVDTSVAHLAGALGKQVWVLLCYNPDWRWLLDREDSPWYLTMRLFRQPQPGDWESVWQEVMMTFKQNFPVIL